MRDEPEPDAVEDLPTPPIGDEGNRRRGQDPPDGSPRGFEHEQDRQTAERYVNRQRIRGAIDEAAEIKDGPRERDGRGADENPVEVRDAPGGCRPRREEQEDEDQRDEQKADAVDLRLDDEKDPVERIEREPDGETGRDQAHPRGEHTAWMLANGVARHGVRNRQRWA